MSIFNLFSKRQKALRGEVPDVYSYDELPENLRVQIVHIIQDAIGENHYGSNDEPRKVYEELFGVLCREYGRFALTNKHDSAQVQILNFILQEEDIEMVLDAIELTFRYLNIIIRGNYNSYLYSTTVKLSPDDAISDLNTRLKENGIGFSFEGNEILRVDSTYTHAEIAKPTIALLWNPKFKGANEEYMKAHEHYRHGRNKECLAECLKAFESTMKIICKEKGWAFDAAKDTASKLIQICFAQQLVPAFMQTHISALKGVLESGIPTVRNKLGGHGQGQVPQKVDDEVARYGLNLTGSNIIFLIEQSGL